MRAAKQTEVDNAAQQAAAAMCIRGAIQSILVYQIHLCWTGILVPGRVQVLCRDAPRSDPVDHNTIASLLQRASAIEEVSRETALHWTFRCAAFLRTLVSQSSRAARVLIRGPVW